ncbi:MAG: tripartite tricarboxylate transporter substrate binding protein [Desulfobacterales bacterium]|jgi:tripartite-type tricarboxylate transporter receptor subunit TctC|nr:tripartite tricarboxylate transporter substrate binding protein [Desulfobacterales bacterium]
MKKHGLKWVGFALVLALMLGASTAFCQEKYPSRPIDFICTWGVGGGSDQMVRMLAKLTEPFLGVPLPVSNKPGASGNSGTTDLLAAKADGYTIANYIADTLATIPTGQARYKMDDIEWIVRTQNMPSFLFVKTDGPFKDIQALLKATQENPGKIKMAGLGFGTIDDITLRYLAGKGHKMTLVPNPNPGERYASVLGGHNEVLYEQAGDIRQYLDAKQLKPVMVFAESRFPAFPDVPCSKELGFNIFLPQFRCVIAKKGVPAEHIKTLVAAFEKAMQTPEWKKFNEDQYADPASYMGGDQFKAWVAGEMNSMEKLMKEFGIIK